MKQSSNIWLDAEALKHLFKIKGVKDVSLPEKGVKRIYKRLKFWINE